MSVRNRAAFYSTGSGYLDLLAAVQRRALQDALAGCEEAAEYLDATQPHWRQQALRFVDVSLIRSLYGESSCQKGHKTEETEWPSRYPSRGEI